MENTAQYQEPEQARQARIIPYLLLLFTMLKCLWFHDRVFIDYLIKVFILTPYFRVKFIHGYHVVQSNIIFS